MRSLAALTACLLGCVAVPLEPTQGVPAVAATAGRAEYVFVHDGIERRFLVYVPPGHEPGRPMMVVLHGGGGNAERMFAGHPLEEAGDEFGYIIVAAQGTPQDGSSDSFEWNAQVSLDSGVDDVGYLEEVIVGVTASLAIDATRRYLAGFSGGASMAVRFGAERSELVTAIGTFAGKVGLSAAGGPFVFPPAPTTPLSIQMTYGSLDPNLDGELIGDLQATSAREGIEWWRDVLGCGAIAETSIDGVVTTDEYAGCSGGGVVRLLVVEGMGHTWPERPGDPVAGTKLLFDFFYLSR